MEGLGFREEGEGCSCVRGLRMPGKSGVRGDFCCLDGEEESEEGYGEGSGEGHSDSR